MKYKKNQVYICLSGEDGNGKWVKIRILDVAENIVKLSGRKYWHGHISTCLKSRWWTIPEFEKRYPRFYEQRKYFLGIFPYIEKNQSE